MPECELWNNYARECEASKRVKINTDGGEKETSTVGSTALIIHAPGEAAQKPPRHVSECAASEVSNSAEITNCLKLRVHLYVMRIWRRMRMTNDELMGASVVFPPLLGVCYSAVWPCVWRDFWSDKTFAFGPIAHEAIYFVVIVLCICICINGSTPMLIICFRFCCRICIRHSLSHCTQVES